MSCVSNQLCQALLSMAQHRAMGIHLVTLYHVTSIHNSYSEKYFGPPGSINYGISLPTIISLLQMDGLTETDELVFVLAATNLPWELDAATNLP